MNKQELIEELAKREHERWADWQTWVHECGLPVPDHLDHEINAQALIIPGQRVIGWSRQIATPYADLSEAEKQSDREQVARYLPLIVAFVTDWIEEGCENCLSAQECAAAWHMEMSDA